VHFEDSSVRGRGRKALSVLENVKWTITYQMEVLLKWPSSELNNVINLSFVNAEDEIVRGLEVSLSL
jgi:hypothetical protein